ncbi:MAG: hypothetical protein KatS3mg039_1379 [Candidatus Kapaibacterium sp.]|nr:MAG: hypothetical protein KatS3mg039_1379 [Candidatus Kapabacteria bacterium]
MRTTLLGVAIAVAFASANVHAQQTTRGRDFYVVFLPNYHNNGDDATDSLYLFIVADQPTTGTITYTNNIGQTQTRTFTISNPQQIVLHRVQYRPYELFGYNNNGTFVTPNENETLSPRVFRVTADRDVAVYALNQALTTSDATLVLPVTTLGTEYYIMSYNTDGVRDINGTLSTQTTPSEFAIVGIEDGTDVTIYPTAPTTETGMQIKNVRINRGQAILYQAEFSRTNLNYDLTGTRIVATKKIAVFAGHQRALVPVQMRGQLVSRDQLYEQMIPRSVWGTTYIITPLAEPQGASPPTQGATDIYRVLAAENGTEIKINGRVVAQLQRGQYYQAPLQQAALLEASQPVMVALFKRSFSSTSDLQLGDPFMMIIPPRRQYLSHYRFQSCQVAHPGGGNTYYEQYITVVTTPNNTRSILLDGDTLVADFKEVPNTCYVYANIRVTDGAHTIESPRLFGLYVYGYGYADSYGYIGGMAFLPDVPDITVSAGPDRELCLGDSITISVQGTAYAVKWSVAPGYPQLVIPCDTCHQITLAPTATTKLQLVGLDSLGCSVSDDVLITVYGKPQIRVRPDTVVCSDVAVTIAAEGSFQSIQWQPTEGLGCSICPQTTVVPQPGTEIVYTAIARNANSEHCETRDSIRVRYAPGLLGKIPPVVTLCEGDSLVLTLDYGGTVRWSPAQGLSCTDCKMVTFRPQRTTRYTVTGDSAGCTTQATIEVRVVAKPTLQPLPDTVICAGESVQLQLVATGADNISISPSTDVSCTGCLTPVFTPTETRTYTVVISAGNGSSQCSVRDSMTITVHPRPSITVSSPLTLCAGDTAVVAATVTGADQVRWEPSDGVLCPTCDSTAIIATTSQTYTITASTSTGCSNQARVQVIVHPRPTLELTPLDTTVCEGTSVHVQATSDGVLEWDRTVPLDCYDCSTVRYLATESRQITVRSRTAEGCSIEGSVQIRVRPLPQITVPDSIRLCIGAAYQLQPIGAQTTYRYQWQPSSGLSCDDCASPIASPQQTTQYVLTTTTLDGCTEHDTVVVAVVPCRIAVRVQVESIVRPQYTCDSATIELLIENPSSLSDQDARIESIEAEVRGGNATVSESSAVALGDTTQTNLLPLLPRMIAVGERWRYRCRVRLSSPEVILAITVRSEDAGDTSVVVTLRSDRQRLRVLLQPMLDPVQPLVPGNNLVYSISLAADQWSVLDIRDLTLQIRYPAELMYYTGSYQVATRTDLGGWSFGVSETVAPDGSLLTISGTGTGPILYDGELLRLTMGTLLGQSYKLEPTIELLPTPALTPCIQLETASQAVTMQLCVRELRFVHVSSTTFGIQEIAPNPANDAVTLIYSLGYDTPVRIELFNTQGQAVAVLRDGQAVQQRGVYQLTTKLNDLPAGMYWCRYVAGHVVQVLPLAVVR